MLQEYICHREFKKNRETREVQTRINPIEKYKYTYKSNRKNDKLIIKENDSRRRKVRLY